GATINNSLAGDFRSSEVYCVDAVLKNGAGVALELRRFPNGAILYWRSTFMLSFVQFPIADLRRFMSGGANRLVRPDFPLVTGTGLPTPFVRAFGSAMRRWRGADYAFLDEQTFCSA